MFFCGYTGVYRNSDWSTQAVIIYYSNCRNKFEYNLIVKKSYRFHNVSNLMSMMKAVHYSSWKKKPMLYHFFIIRDRLRLTRGNAIPSPPPPSNNPENLLSQECNGIYYYTNHFRKSFNWSVTSLKNTLSFSHIASLIRLHSS